MQFLMAEEKKRLEAMANEQQETQVSFI